MPFDDTDRPRVEPQYFFTRSELVAAYRKWVIAKRTGGCAPEESGAAMSADELAERQADALLDILAGRLLA
jgi:hypothetical protein